MNTGRHGSGSALHDHFSLLSLFTKSFTVWPGPAYSLFYMENGQDASGLLDLPSTKITMSQHSIQCSSVSALWPGRSRLGRVAWEDWSPEEGSFCLQQPEFLSPGELITGVSGICSKFTIQKSVLSLWHRTLSTGHRENTHFL